MLTSQKQKSKSQEFTTEFQVHVNVRSQDTRNIIDLTERKLRLLITTGAHSLDTTELKNVLQRYVKGDIAVAWRAGLPRFITLTRDK